MYMAWGGVTLCKVYESIELKPRKGFPREHFSFMGVRY